MYYVFRQHSDGAVLVSDAIVLEELVEIVEEYLVDSGD